MTGAKDFFNEGEIAVESGKILSVGPIGSTPEGWEPNVVLGGSNFLAMPGLINGHTHAGMTLLRGYADDLPLMQWLQEKIWPFEDKLTSEDIYWGTKLCIIEMIMSGTTTLVDMYFDMDRVAQAVEESGFRASLSRGMVGFGANSELAIQQSKELIETWHGKADGRIQVLLGPHAPYTCSPEYLKRVIKLSEEYGVGINIHLAETKGEVEDITKQYGKSPIRLMEEVGLFNRPVVAPHCVHVDDEEIAILAKYKVGVIHNPESNMKLGSGVCPVSKLLQAGVKVGIGTDGASSNNNLDLFGEIRSAAFLQKVNYGATALPAFQALEMATVNGAKALGLEKLGLLIPGYKADIILIDLHKPHLYPRHDLVANLAYSAHSSDVHTAIIDGKVVMQDRKVQTLDVERTIAEVQSRAEAIKDQLAASALK